jgi:hypothetical protein
MSAALRLAAALAVLLCAATAGALQAFPGAEGFGAETPGGRADPDRPKIVPRVRIVDRLDDTAAGSAPRGTLRWAVTRSGPRIVVFRVAGTITLKRTLQIEEPYLTIAGQSAPGGGIALRRGFDSREGWRTLVTVATHDVVIRHLRLRPGPYGATDAKGAGDALSIGAAGKPAWNVVIDHCSISWATDELVQVVAGSHDVTIQRSLLSEALRSRGPWPLYPGYGFLADEHPDNDRVSLHHNLFAHNHDRNPQIQSGGVWDLVNNVVYDAGGTLLGAKLMDYSPKPLRLNSVANFSQPGPSSRLAPGAELTLYEMRSDGAPRGFEVYTLGNIGPSRPNIRTPGALAMRCFTLKPAPPHPPCTPMWASRSIVPQRHAAPPVTTVPAGPEMRNAVVAEAGATLPRRDAVDACVAANVASGRGAEIPDPSDPRGCGPWPILAASLPPPDADGDGLPDAFEAQYAVADPIGDADGDGFLNVEEWLNGTDPTRADVSHTPVLVPSGSLVQRNPLTRR